MKKKLLAAPAFVLACAISVSSQAHHVSQKGFVVVHARSTEQLVSALVRAANTGRPTLVKVAPGRYRLTERFDSEFGWNAFPLVRSTVVIEGRDAAKTVLDGEGNVAARAFAVATGGRLVLRDLTINGMTFMCEERFDCDRVGGGAIANFGGSVWLEDCVVSSNAIFFENGSHFVRGGAISSVEGYLQLLDTDVLDNVAFGFGAGLSLQGGAATIMRSNVNGNHARIGIGNGGSLLGGGIFASGTKLDIYESTVARNVIGETFDFEWLGFGAGLYNDGGTVRLVNSAVVENTALFSGAGGGIVNGGSMFIANSTIGGNSAGLFGGGIFNGNELALQHVTVTDNIVTGSFLPGPDPSYPPGCEQVEAPEKCIMGGGGIWNEPAGVVHLAGTVIAGNATAGAASDCNNTLVSMGYNALGTSASCELRPLRRGDQLNLDARLGELLDNGEAGTAHYPLLADSPLIDADGRANHSHCSRFDQLGHRRTDGDGDGEKECDIGAIELTVPR